MTTARDIQAEAIVEAIDIANAIRDEFGEEQIVDLPPAIRYDVSECVLAKAFNFGCKIYANVQGQWFVEFGPENEEKAKFLAGLLNTEPLSGNLSGRFRILLPRNIAKIAIAFDDGALPDRYYEDRP